MDSFGNDFYKVMIMGGIILFLAGFAISSCAWWIFGS